MKDDSVRRSSCLSDLSTVANDKLDQPTATQPFFPDDLSHLVQEQMVLTIPQFYKLKHHQHAQQSDEGPIEWLDVSIPCSWLICFDHYEIINESESSSRKNPNDVGVEYSMYTARSTIEKRYLPIAVALTAFDMMM